MERKELPMGKEEVLFRSEAMRSTADVAQFLRQLAEKVEAGEVILRQGADELVLTLPQTVTLEVKAEEESSSKGPKHSLEVELEWRPGEEESAAPLELG
jgi:amphi-Trp domain-containing protein